MKALVTGGAGFLGSHLCEYLIEKGYSVKAIDNLSTGRYDNIRHLEGNGAFDLTVGTVFNKPLIEELVKETDIIFHLASAVGVKNIMDRPVQSIETIIRGTSFVLFQAKRYNVPVVITSSSEVYGRGSKVPFCEGDDIVLGSTTKRRWLYAASKAIDEFLAFGYYWEAKLPVVCVRLFNTVGPRQTGQYGMVIPTFIKQAQSGRDITVHGDGTQTRCFTHVADAIRALVDLSECREAVGKVVNIGTEDEVSIENLAWKVKELTGSSSRVTYTPYSQVYGNGFEDTQRRVPDLALAHSLINYQPKYGIDDILRDMIAWRKSA